jgi:antitoxin (DNA-binding transcriptional repressor) of toxin-antitoxin stability system
MATRIISATEANRNLSDILSKVQYQHQSFDIKRGKDIIARLVPATASSMPISELNDLFKRLPALDEEDKVDMERVLSELRASNADVDAWD